MAIFTPHDRLFHSTFRHPRFVAAWLRHLLPPPTAAAIDFATLTPASERAIGLRLRAHFPDLVFHARIVGSDEEVLLLLEHKHGHDPGLRSQVLRYAVHLRRLAQKRGGKEPLVVPVVLHHGAEPFRPEARQQPPPFAALQPHVEFLVDDLFGQDDAALRRPGLPPQAQLTLLALAGVPRFTPEYVLAAIDRWGDLLRAIEAGDADPTPDDALEAFAEYLLATTDVSLTDLQMAFSRNLQDPDTSLMTTAQRLRQEGLTQGLTQGLNQGRTQGQALTLIRQLTRRFGPLPAELLQRVQSAASRDLDLWTDRVLDARTLPEVFAP